MNFLLASINYIHQITVLSKYLLFLLSGPSLWETYIYNLIDIRHRHIIIFGHECVDQCHVEIQNRNFRSHCMIPPSPFSLDYRPGNIPDMAALSAQVQSEVDISVVIQFPKYLSHFHTFCSGFSFQIYCRIDLTEKQESCKEKNLLNPFLVFS